MKLKAFLAALLLSGTASALTLNCTVVDGTVPSPTPEPPPVAQCSNQLPNITQRTMNIYTNRHFDDAIGNGVMSYKFTTQSGRAFGDISVAKLVSGTSRTIWISECPGQIPTTKLGTACSKYGTEAANIAWSTYNTGEAWRCTLQQGKTYYLNIKHAPPSNITSGMCTSGNCAYRVQTGYRTL